MNQALNRENWLSIGEVMCGWSCNLLLKSFHLFFFEVIYIFDGDRCATNANSRERCLYLKGDIQRCTKLEPRLDWVAQKRQFRKEWWLRKVNLRNSEQPGMKLHRKECVGHTCARASHHQFVGERSKMNPQDGNGHEVEAKNTPKTC